MNNTLGQGCVDVSNVSSVINGSVNNINSYGLFQRGSSEFPFDEGIVLSTGNVISAGNTEIPLPLDEGEDNWLTDPDLENIFGVSETLNATSIQFDFASISNEVTFNYILASEEYFGVNPCNYSDTFAILIKEAGTTDPFVNIATVPGTSLPVNTTNIHDEIFGYCDASYPEYFEGYGLGDTNFNGRTTVLSAVASIQPNVNYTIKFIIADNEDRFYDSAVFIQSDTTEASVDLGEDISTCADSAVLNADIGNAVAAYSWFINDNLIAGENAPTLNVDTSGTYRVEISIQFDGSTCVISDFIEVVLSSAQTAEPIPNYELCDDQTEDFSTTFDFSEKDTDVLAIVPPGSNYNISYHTTLNGAENNTGALPTLYDNTSNPQNVFVRIEDIDNGCVSFSNFDLIVKPLPAIGTVSDITLCDTGASDGSTSINLQNTTLEVTNGNDALLVSYHRTLNQAINATNQVNQPYTNTLPNETLYINVRDPETGCSNITSFDITVLEIPNIDVNTTHYINACDTSGNGFAVFALNTIVNDVLQGVTGVDVSFHQTMAAAQTGANPITSISTYQNTVANFQTVYIRVVDPNAGCPAIAPIELHTNLAETGLDLSDNFVCDDASGDGIAEFDLVEVEEQVLNGFDDFTLTYYDNETDQTNGSNPLDISVPFEVSSSPKEIFITAQIGSCTTFVSTYLVINPTIEIQPLGTVDYCDDDTDGFTTIFLNSFNSYVSQGISNPFVVYYRNEDDALNDENRLNNNFTNTINPQQFYVRVTNTQTSCFDVAPITINVYPATITSVPTDIIICDSDQDGFAFINLNAKISEIVSSTTNLEISFHETNDQAVNDELAIPLPSSYNSNTQIIYVRVENQTTGCFSIVELPVYINTVPVFEDISDFENCEEDGTVVSEFFFYLKDEDILNGQDNKDVLYFESEQDAIDRVNIIDKFSGYTNISVPQTIYVRVESLNDPSCFGISEFDLAIGFLPDFNQPTDIFLCDDISNDGEVTIDLNDKYQEIIAGISENLNISFYTKYSDALTSINEVSGSYTNTNNPQQVFAKIDDGTNCFSIVDFVINVIPAPDVSPFSDLVICDDNYDETAVFNITDAEVEITDVRIEDIEVTYHYSFTGAENDSDIIANTTNFTNTSNPQTVFIKVNDILSNCNVILPINLVVDTPPALTNLQVYNGCDIEEGFIDLSDINSSLTDTTNNTNFSYYFSEADAQSETGALDTIYYYTSLNLMLYARLENQTTGCYIIKEFELILNPLPDVVMPDSLRACDDPSNDDITLFDLSNQSNIILGTQNPNNFTVTYYETEINAENGTNVLDPNYNGQHLQTIYAIIENNTTGCFNTTQFDLLINDHPETPSVIMICDTDYDGLTTLDITQVESQLYPVSNPNDIITYFESLEDLNADTNQIQTPTNYSNNVNPQPIFVKVFNIEYNCFTYVNFFVDVNLPPAINLLDTYDICENLEQNTLLSGFNPILLQQNTNVLINYFASEADAMSQVDALDDVYFYQSNFDQLYVRVEFSTTNCFYIHPFNLKVNPLPIANEPPKMEICDDNFDGLYNFDFTQQDTFVLNGQNPSDYFISYYGSLESADEGTNALPETYEASSFEIVYVRIENIETNCFSVTQFMTVVRPKPYVDIPEQVICLNDLPLLVSAETNNPDHTYLWSTNQTTAEIEIDQTGTYSVTVTSSFGCTTTSVFEVSESESASIDFTETIDFSDPNNVTVTISGIGNYLYQINNLAPQTSNVLENVPLGNNTITVIDQNGCASVSKDIVIIDTPKFMTPNGDSRFDTWHITGVERLPGTIVYIFDRYGKLLKTLSSSSAGWNGTYNGKLMPAADYWYVAVVKDGSDEFEVRGHFALRY